MKQTFFLGDRCLGSREIPASWPAAFDSKACPARFQHTNIAYCCPTCGEIWGRVWHEVAMPGWQFEVRQCAKHPILGFPWTDWKRGSFMHPFPEHEHPLRFEADWPDDVVRWEFKLLMDKLEKEQG